MLTFDFVHDRNRPVTPPIQTITGTSQEPVKTVDRARDLSLIVGDGVGGVIWQRQMPEGFQNWIDGLSPLRLPAVRAILPPQETRAVVTEVCQDANTPNGLHRDWLIDDVCFLADTFVEVMNTPFLQLRFDVVSDDACRKFHVDMVRARLICTYRGKGTQYGVQPDGIEPRHISNVRTGDPILLRGNLWPSRKPNHLRHRSPPIAETGDTRLILVLDAIETLEDPRRVHVLEPKHRISEVRSDDRRSMIGNCE